MLKINAKSSEDESGEAAPNDSPTVDQALEVPADESKKRARDTEDDDDGDSLPTSKRAKPDGNGDDGPNELRASGTKRNFDLSEDKLSKLRRSPRLRQEIKQVWKSLKDGKNKKRNP